MPPGPDQSSSGRRLSVLVVEDQFLIALQIVDVIEDAGHDVLGPSNSVEDALQLLETERPDFAVLDVDLHGHLVTPVAERLSALGIPFVLASAHPTDAFDGSPILLNTPNVGKPMDEARLAEALNRAHG